MDPPEQPRRPGASRGPAETAPYREPSTHRYPAGTEGYSSAGEEATLAGESDADGPRAGDGDPLKFWAQLGFESFDAYLAHVEDLQTRGRSRLGERVPVARVPGAELGDHPAPERPYLRQRQVNVKLRSPEGEELDRAAALYGLAPTTLARLLVNRGVRAILDG